MNFHILWELNKYTFWRSIRSNAVRRHPPREGEYLPIRIRWGSSPSSRYVLTSFDVGSWAHPKNLHDEIPGGRRASPYSAILGRPTLNAFQAIIFTYHVKIKFPAPRGVGEVQGDLLQSRKCYVEAVQGAQGALPNERGKDVETEEEPEGGGDAFEGQPAEKLLNIKLIPGDSKKPTLIGSQIDDATRKEVIQCLQHNIDIFAWIPQDLEGIDPNVITYYLNIDPNIKLLKQKKRHFGPKKDKIIQAEVDKLMIA
ncbi:UNVERIFIED_CONTAM: hypothetical protein Slati_3854200 [Sesamum latifolium]|uniref:Reverse transcriptase domain-containing protein n=1 Tax=Sesamum latifolium TaxID=2727402 RepID=A0AAW2TKD2_9LAMI